MANSEGKTPPKLRRNSKIGGYLLVAPIEEGPHSSLWQAEDMSLGRHVSLRILDPECSADEKVLDSFKREANAAGRLSHPSFLRILEMEEEDRYHFLVQEHQSERQSLYELLEDKQLRNRKRDKSWFRNAARDFAHLAEGLQEAHEAGVLHRGISPRVITYSPDEKLPKLSGFGLATVASRDEWSSPTGETTFAMTDFGNPGKAKKKKRILRPYYISPEQSISRQEGLDHRTDIWSLGAVFFEVLTLHRPFDGQTIEDVLRQCNTGDPFANKNRLKGVPADLIAICQKALNKDRDKRYISMAEFSEDCRAFLDNRPQGLEHENMLVLTRKYVTRHPGRAVAALLLVAGVPLFSWQQWQAGQLEKMGAEMNAQLSEMEEIARFRNGEEPPPGSSFKGPGELWLVALGVGNYNDDKLDLKAPTRDVDDLVEFFRKQHGENQPYTDIHEFILKDEEVQPEALQEILYEELMKAKPEDTIIAFVAGHGALNDRGRYFFLKSDTTFEKVSRGIEREDLDALILDKDLLPRKRLLVYDTCASGTSTESLRGGKGWIPNHEMNRLVDHEAGGYYIIAASRDIGFAREDPNGNGYLTEGLLKALAGEADKSSFGDNNGVVSVEELKNFVLIYVREKTVNKQHVTFPSAISGENFYVSFVPKD